MQSGTGSWPTADRGAFPAGYAGRMPRRLYVTLRSPYARKAWMALLEKSLPAEVVAIDLEHRPPDFAALSPIGKVPLLVDDDGTTVPDSTVICEYLEDRYRDAPLRGKGWETRLAVRQVDELGDALSDQAVALFFARRDGNTSAEARAVATSNRLLDALDTAASSTGAPFCGALSYGDLAVLSALGYQAFRHGDAWREGRDRLARWFDAVDARPAAVATRPRLA